MGLFTVGVNVMVGQTYHVSNGKLFNLHCVCHRPALACTDSCEELKLIKEVGEVLQKLWYYFHKQITKSTQVG